MTKATSLSSVKKLAGQTLWYGLPTIGSRFLGYFLNFSLTFLYQAADTADLTQIYAIVPFLNILFTYGMETGYFRFVQQTEQQKLFNTLSVSMVMTTALLTAAMYFAIPWLAGATMMEAHPEYFVWLCGIVAFDTLATLPLAKLRQEGRPVKFAFVRVSGIVLNVLIVVYYVGVCPKLAQTDPQSIWLIGYDKSIGIGYYLIGNLAGSVLTWLLLLTEWKGFRFEFDRALWAQVLRYSAPLLIVGFGGMINEMLSRLVYQQVVDMPAAEAKRQLGIFAANYRLAVLITIFIQMFRMAAEPFYFNQSKDKEGRRTYARVMKYFVIACCFMFLGIGLFRDVLQAILSIRFAEYGEGIHIVPILAMGSIFLGIYYNLSIWYKLTNRNGVGAMITILGALITLGLNIWWIPLFGYTGSAWATFTCYAFMMVVSYWLGQKKFRVPYAKKKMIAYLVIITLIYLLHRGLVGLYEPLWFSITSGMVLYLLFFGFMVIVERRAFAGLPVVGRFFSAAP